MQKTLEIPVVERTSTEVGNSRDFSHSMYSWDVNSSKKNNSCRATSNSRVHYNSWDGTQGKPTAAITSATEYEESAASAEAARLLWIAASNIRDVNSNYIGTPATASSCRSGDLENVIFK
jgi:hypothetical protein